MLDLATFQLAFAAAMARTGCHGSLERQPGFSVYRNTAPNALIEVLRGSYPVVAEILGDAFTGVALAFVRAHPPVDPVLIRYGAGFGDFLAQQPELADLPYLPGVAAIERAQGEAQDAADAEPLAWSDLDGIGEAAWGILRLPLHPATRFAWLTTPAVTIWQAHRDGFQTLAPEWRPEGALIVRPYAEVALLPIDAALHRLLFGLMLRESVGQAAAATATIYPDCDLAGMLATLVNSGALAKPQHLERI